MGEGGQGGEGHRRLVLPLLLLLTGAGALWACAPFFPNWLLGSEDLLAAPSALFTESLRGLEPAESPPFPSVRASDPADETVRVETEDVQRAVAQSLPFVREAILKGHAELRAALRQGQPPTDVRVPRGLPAELADYLAGAAAWYQKRPAAARTAWERLLARPAAARRLRSTWAAYMLGRLAMANGDPDAAVRWFERTRALAQQGFPDPLGLAFDSLGWQARTEMDRGRYDLALPLYLEQSRGGDEGALNSVRLACAEALQGDEEDLVRAARDPRSRAILTAWVLTPGDDERGIVWLHALQQAKIQDVDGADRLAWVAYQEADFDTAWTWVQRAREDAPMARWIRAKLLLRRGRLDEAQTLLHQVAAALPPAAMSEEDAWMYAWDTAYNTQLATGPQAGGEEAAVLLARGRYPEALNGFLRNGYWLDAAWVGERVMTTDELKAAVDKSWPADLAARFQPGETDLFAGGFIHPRPEWVASSIRYLLARRLIREGRYSDARAYLPPSLVPDLEKLEDGVRTGTAKSLEQSARIARTQGMELFGTEVDPDWFALEKGAYELPGYIDGLAARGRHHLPPPAPGERTRTERHKVKPWKRFHYRYRAAALARQAADRLPDGSADKARLLATGGWWLAYRDPQAALPFYKEIVRCCSKTALGREALQKHWLPEVPQ